MGFRVRCATIRVVLAFAVGCIQVVYNRTKGSAKTAASSLDSLEVCSTRVQGLMGRSE